MKIPASIDHFQYNFLSAPQSAPQIYQHSHRDFGRACGSRHVLDCLASAAARLREPIAAAVSQKVTVSFDGLGEPHITAASEDDLLFAQGYLTAQERMWQMDTLRRLAGGDLSRDRRRGGARIRSRGAAAAAAAHRRGDLRHAARRGSRRDRRLRTRRQRVSSIRTAARLPLEFTLLGYDPRPWSVVDSILIGLHMFRNLTTTYPDELLKQNMLAGGDPAKVNFLFPVRTGHEAPPGTLQPAGAELQPGSNAWAIAGGSHRFGKADPLERHAPGILDSRHLVPGAPASARA